MRKNTARHWLHASLDLLPVILIPVFMIYSHRHVLTERTEVYIQYKYQSNEVNSVDDLIIGNVYQVNINEGDYPSDFINEGGYLTFEVLSEIKFQEFLVDTAYDIEEISPHTYITLFDVNSAVIYINDVINETSFVDVDTIGDFVDSFIIKLINFDLVDYTYFAYTDYNEIESVDVQDTNSSIMNVFMDDFNYSVNKYFNMGNVFNLKDVYHWFEVNIFNNNPPVVMASIYNIIVYEFVMDLLFLLYGLFMWFVDMLKRLIEKPIDSIK